MAQEVPARGSILGKCLPARYVLAILGSIGMAIIYGLKVNLSVAMVAMLNHTAIGHSSHDAPLLIVDNTTSIVTAATVDEVEICQSPDAETNGTTTIQDGPFIWSEPLQGTLLSCYFWGYLVSQIPGARVAENYSAKWVMLFSVAINVICTLLTPVLTKAHYVGLIAMRVLEGIGGGATFPAMHCMIAAWAPPNERSVMSTIIYVGTSFGTAISILLAGLLSGSYGWESVFYVMGGLSCIWMLLWVILVQDNPNKQTFISLEERQMITSQLGTMQAEGAPAKEEHPPVPWGKVLTSVPFLAILIAHCCSNWGWYMFLIEIPFYMKQVLAFNVSSNAVASALPYFPMLIFSIILGKTLDALKAKQKITTTIARKTATSIATVIPGICLLSLCYIGCKHTAAVVLMCFGIIGMGGMFSGFLSNHIDIAPNYAGTLVALTNTAATLPGIIVPLFVGFITKGNQNINAWRIIFFVTIVLFIIEFLVFVIFGSGEEQSWNKRTVSKDTERADQDESTPLKPTTVTTPSKNNGA
ncbi:putative inorganic phosphate cotransporter [Teleopsis dalmanni]|uniref:putative inorganic phosphate cotransporter n=1 Tax=Teleopsis dalmanni TaxID=139649 RepID=UPI000D32B4E2|nr:putative inorganic phosphate cotransporter [Teleopsis dalmanni]